MSNFIFHIGVDRNWSGTLCGACRSGLIMDAETERSSPFVSSCICDDFDEDPWCECPSYFHRILFEAVDDGETHVKIEMNVPNPGARRITEHSYEVYEFDFAPSTDDSDIEIFRPHLHLFKILFMSTKMRATLTDVVGRMRTKRVGADAAIAEVKAVSEMIYENIVSMFSAKSEKRTDIRWIQPVAKTLCHAIMLSSNIPVMKEDKGCAHVDRKKKHRR